MEKEETTRGSATKHPGGSRSTVNWRWIVDWLSKWVLPFYFAAFALGLMAFFIGHGLLGIDGRIYTRAAAEWLAGGNPWQVPVEGYLFAAPPPTLLPFVPFAFIGEAPSAVIWVAGSGAAGVLLVRWLGLPLWWVLFPPLVNGVLAGNADVLLVALLVRGGAGGVLLATFLKIYAVIPALGERRWRALALTAAALLITIPFLPWRMYLAQWGHVADTLERQAIGISAWGTPFLMVGVAIALGRLGPRLASWLAVPALWPSTQLHYSTLALPALARMRATTPATVLVAAMLLAPENRWFPALAVIALAIGAVLHSLSNATNPAASRQLQSAGFSAVRVQGEGDPSDESS